MSWNKKNGLFFEIFLVFELLTALDKKLTIHCYVRFKAFGIPQLWVSLYWNCYIWDIRYPCPVNALKIDFSIYVISNIQNTNYTLFCTCGLLTACISLISCLYITSRLNIFFSLLQVDALKIDFFIFVISNI